MYHSLKFANYYGSPQIFIFNSSHPDDNLSGPILVQVDARDHPSCMYSANNNRLRRLTRIRNRRGNRVMEFPLPPLLTCTKKADSGKWSHCSRLWWWRWTGSRAPCCTRTGPAASGSGKTRRRIPARWCRRRCRRSGPRKSASRFPCTSSPSAPGGPRVTPSSSTGCTCR